MSDTEEKKELLETLGSNIRRFRKVRGLTINQLAIAVNSDIGNISRLERGQQGYSHDLLFNISKALNVNVSELFRCGRIPPHDEVQKTALRIPKDLHLDINSAAKASGRTMNAEIVHRLKASFTFTPIGTSHQKSIENKEKIIDEIEKLLEMLKHDGS